MAKVGSFLANQGTVDQNVPEPQLLVSFSDADVSIPVWTDLTSRMRGYDSQRGRGSELSDFDAGSCSVALNNRDRALDPMNAAGPYYPNIRPMNRLWLRVHWAGTIHDVFTGWTESAPQTYPGMVDALVTLRATDEFKPLALDGLPATDPPRDTYPDLVLSDQPLIYWRMNDSWEAKSQKPLSGGPDLVVEDSSPSGGGNSSGAIVGENLGDDAHLSIRLDGGTRYITAPYVPYAIGDLTLSPEFAIEVWVQASDATPAGANVIIQGIGTTGPSTQWSLALNTDGTVSARARNQTGPATVTATSTTALADGAWYHIVGTITGGNLRIYVNGTLEASTAFSGVIAGYDGAGGAEIALGTIVSGETNFTFDEVALYPTGLTGARVLAHYTAGRSRGFARDQLAHERIIAVLDAVSSHAPRSIRTGARNMTGAFMRGQAPLEELRDVVHGEAVDASLFVAADGTVTFLDAAHRGSSPWTTAQATFGDSGSELPYQDITVDYSDSFLVNEWNVTTEGGLTQTARDTTSIAAYLKRPQSITGLKITNGDAVALTIASDLLAKTKDPMVRITGVQPQMANGPAATAALTAELGDKVRVKRRPPGGGAVMDQQSFVQQISVSGTPQDVYPIVKLGVSPV